MSNECEGSMIRKPMQMRPATAWIASLAIVCLSVAFGRHPSASAQSVILPMPRLLTLMPMGGTVGETVEVTISGQYLDGATDLRFSDPRVTAEPVRDAQDEKVPGAYRVTIADDCPIGLVEARVLTRLGISSPRVFSISAFPEVTQTKPTTALETALPLKLDSICNAIMPTRAVNHYRFECDQGQRVVIECAAQGIDSKLKPVLIVADEQGRDLVVQRRGDVIDFTAPKSGTYVIKVHELTYKGGPEFFYRLVLRAAAETEIAAAGPSTRSVSSFSWPPHGLPTEAASQEREPNNRLAEAQPIELPCDLSGRFATAADVDMFRFAAKKGEVWWVEVASERLGRPTDPSLIVQRIVRDEEGGKSEDVAELSDIPSPVKVSTNHYRYDGPPYHAGSPDIIGKFEVPEDGDYLIRLVDLFGGTRSDPRNVYRMLVRRAAPDFALVAWAMHMELRNGDRNAVSKPIALRSGSTMPLEVVAVRRDGFDGPIELFMENLPDGVTARGITIPRGENRGLMLVTADEGAPDGLSEPTFFGRASIDGQVVTRRCHLASMAWPVTDHWKEIPSPRLLDSIAVSVSGAEPAPITISPRESKVWETLEGETLTIPLIHMRRSEFSGSVINASTMGHGFERFKLEIPLDADSSEAVIDLAALKTPPGDYRIALYGGAVAKYRYNVDAVSLAESHLKDAEQELADTEAEVSRLTQQLAGVPDEMKAKLQSSLDSLTSKEKELSGRVKVAGQRLKEATAQAKPKDIVDIVVSEPIEIRVKAAEK